MVYSDPGGEAMRIARSFLAALLGFAACATPAQAPVTGPIALAGSTSPSPPVAAPSSTSANPSSHPVLPDNGSRPNELFLAGSASATTEPPPPSSAEPSAATTRTEIVSAEFGLFGAAESGDESFSPSASVPLRDGQAYGWVIVLKTDKPRIKWREEFTLPVAPVRWGGEGEGRLTVSRDRRTAVTKQTDEPQDGIISHRWTVAPGDPEGHHVMRVLVDGRLERVFEFDVKAATRTAPKRR
jgi:hypothetical protein